MRLTDHQIKIIQQVAVAIFGQTAKVYLFGSRVNDLAKGGDIDLLIDAKEDTMTSRNKVLFLVQVKKQLGEQKIDVVYNQPGRKDHFISSIRKKAILITENPQLTLK